ncbi:MAG: Ppx/GppA family phosphatase [Pseudomonadota bacterium]
MTDAPAHRVGVIDIGSNSVRLVIFAISGAAMYPTFNEKVMAGLGRSMGETGKLSPPGRVLALAALARFRAILKGLGVSDVSVVATAAVRVAEDGPDFAREAARVAGAELSVLSGLDEARLSALGVTAGFFQAQGVVADLGGSSLELLALGGDTSAGETHMLGPLALQNGDLSDELKIRETVRHVLAGSDCVRAGISDVYAVGGAWRSFAKVAMEATGYPLHVLHGYRMPAKMVSEVTDYVIAHQGNKRLSDIAGRRAAQLHLTSIVLDELTNASGAEHVVVSSYGLREGAVAERLGLNGRDALIDGLTTFADLNPFQVRFSEQLYAFTRPIFEEKSTAFEVWDLENRLHKAACYLVDSAGKYHPDHRDEMGFDKTLYAPLSGVSHPERVFLAAALGWRYSRRFDVPDTLSDLLTPKQLRRARQLGHAMRLGAVFSGRSADILKLATLERRDERLVLCLPRAHSAMVSETVERRLNQTADILGLSPGVSLR